MNRIAATLATIALTMAAAPALATSPHTVDPATMTPELNPGYAPWTCVRAGTGITCTGYQDLAHTTSIQTNLPADRLTLSATGEGSAVFLSGGWHKHYVYPVPGDLTQRVLT